MGKIPVLSANDIKRLQQVLREQKDKARTPFPVNTINPPASVGTYIGWPTSSAGIPALTSHGAGPDDDEPGSGDCDIYRVYKDLTGTAVVEAIDIEDKEVFNFSTSVIPQEWIIIFKQPNGRWVVPPPSTNTNTDLIWCVATADWQEGTGTTCDDPYVMVRHASRCGVVEDPGETPFAVYLPRKRAEGIGLDPSVYEDDIISYKVDAEGNKICQTPYLWSFIGQIMEYGSVSYPGKIPTGWEVYSAGTGRTTIQLDAAGETNEQTVGNIDGFTWHGASENGHPAHTAQPAHTVTAHGTHTLDTHDAHTIADHDDHPDHDHHPLSVESAIDAVGGASGVAGDTTGYTSYEDPDNHRHSIQLGASEVWPAPDESSGATAIGAGTSDAGLFSHSTHVDGPGTGVGLGHAAHAGTALTDTFEHTGSLGHGESSPHLGLYNGGFDSDNRQKFIVVNRIIRIK